MNSLYPIPGGRGRGPRPWGMLIEVGSSSLSSFVLIYCVDDDIKRYKPASIRFGGKC